MKTKFLTLAFLFLTFCLAGQTYKTWSGTYNTQYGDTTLAFSGKDVAGCSWSMSFEYGDLSADSSFIVNVGGSNIFTDDTYSRYIYAPIDHDSLPYTIDSTTIGDTVKSIYTNERFPFKEFMLNLDVKPLDSADINYRVNFVRP